MNYKKKFLSLYICINFLFVSLFNVANTQYVYADTLAISAFTSGVSLVSSSGALTSALSVSALPALAIVSGAVACGLIYKNRTQIKDFTLGAFNYLSSIGQGIDKGICYVGNNAIKITSDAKKGLLNYISLLKNNKINGFQHSLINTINVPANSVVKTNIVIPFSTDLDINLKMLKTGKNHLNNCRFKYTMDGFPNVNVNDFCRNSSSINYSPSINMLYLGNKSISLPKYGNICVDIENTGNFDVDLGIVQDISYNNSICADIDIVPKFNDKNFSKDVDTYIHPSKSFSWDDALEVKKNLPANVVSISNELTDIIPNVNENSNTSNLDVNLPNNVELDFSPLYFSFKDKFPFSIPYDIYSLFKTFSSDVRIPPKFNVVFDKGFVGKAEFTIDFSKFDLIACISRYFLLLMFLVGLMKITRNLIKG